MIIIITITFANEIQNNDYEFIQVLDLIPRKCLRNLGFVQLGRNYFDEKAKVNINLLILKNTLTILNNEIIF